jgi:hypothetical protein
VTSAGLMGTWVRHQVALASLAEVLTVLERAAIPALAVKGIVLAYVLHDDVAKRPLSDVDLRVRPGDFVRAVRAMRAHGFAPQWSSRQLGAVTFEVHGTSVEFETSVGPPGLCALGVTRMVERAKARVLAGTVRVLAPEIHDHAVLMIVNAYKDKMVSCPSWSVGDLETILSHVDISTLLTRIEEAHVRAIAWIAGDWMARELGSESWRNLRDRIGTHPPRRLYAWAMRRWMTRGSFMTRALARVGSDSAPRRVWALGAGGVGTAVSWLAQKV